MLQIVVTLLRKKLGRNCLLILLIIQPLELGWSIRGKNWEERARAIDQLVRIQCS